MKNRCRLADANPLVRSSSYSAQRRLRAVSRHRPKERSRKSFFDRCRLIKSANASQWGLSEGYNVHQRPATMLGQLDFQTELNCSYAPLFGPAFFTLKCSAGSRGSQSPKKISYWSCRKWSNAQCQAPLMNAPRGWLRDWKSPFRR